MRYAFIFIMILILSANLFAGNDAYIIPQSSFVKIMPLYQNWKIADYFSISEISVPVFLYFPIGHQMSLSLQGNQANIDGDVKIMNGLTDTQLNLSYHWEPANLVFNVGVNYPSGKKELTATEFQTSALLSLSYFNFQVPNFGQGLNLSPGLTWALPLNEKFVIGLGASYQYKGKFKPLEGMPDDYDPGDEILLTGGFDLRLNEKTTFVTDVIYTIYGADKIKETDVFVSGDKMQVSAKLRILSNDNQLLIFAHYRSKAKNSYVIGGVLQEEFEKNTPDQIDVMGHYRARLNQKVSATLIAEGRFFQPAGFFKGATIFGLGIAPEILLTNNLTAPMKVKYFWGNFKNSSDISGFELGVGLWFKF